MPAPAPAKLKTNNRYDNYVSLMEKRPSATKYTSRSLLFRSSAEKNDREIPVKKSVSPEHVSRLYELNNKLKDKLLFKIKETEKNTGDKEENSPSVSSADNTTRKEEKYRVPMIVDQELKKRNKT